MGRKNLPLSQPTSGQSLAALVLSLFLEILSQGDPKLSGHTPGTGSSPAPSTCMGKQQAGRQKSFGWFSLAGGWVPQKCPLSRVSKVKEKGFWCRLCPDVQLQCGEHLASHSTVCTFINWKLNSLGFSSGKQLLCYSWTSVSSHWKSPGTSASILRSNNSWLPCSSNAFVWYCNSGRI